MSATDQREEIVFEAARQLPAEQRAAYLDQACAGDPALRQRVEALLRADEEAGTLLEPAVNPLTVSPVTEKPGDRIGRYKLLQQIGEGGCGVVYMAEQQEPVHRRVALKIIKLGMDTKQVIARFEAERQALALMDHPNIAKVLDAGATETGRPFFVMELVRGVAITHYCDENKLPMQQRLALFVQVCQAVQHAHQKGIIHRDLKPSNILVTVNDGVPVPKVIDFGIAKATTGQQLTDKTVFTAFEQFIGTPAYMSPEQAAMTSLDVDTRSDIYSLGVLLYELLAGKPPFDPQELLKAGFDEMRRTIRENEPIKPSTRLSTMLEGELTRAARNRHTEPPRLIHLVRGDLDWIVMKCLEKDRSRRYETANGLAADIKRHLNNEPIVARPPSRLYRFQKTVQRNKLAFMAVTAVFVALTLGVIGTTVGFARSERQRCVAEAARRQAEKDFEIARAAVKAVLAVSDEELHDVPGMQPLRVKLMRAAIDRYKPLLEQPSEDPELRADLARLYVKYGLIAFSTGADRERVVIPAYQSARAILEQLVREYPRGRRLRSDLGWANLAFVWWADANAAANRQAVTRAIDIFETLVSESPEDPLARADLAWALYLKSYSKSGEERPLADRALAIREQLVKEFPESSEFRFELAVSLRRQAGFFWSKPAAALPLVSRAIELNTAVVADMENHADNILVPLRPEDSVAIVRQSLYWEKRDLAADLVMAARLSGQLGNWTDGLALSDRAVHIYHQLVEQNPSVRVFITELGDAAESGAKAAEQLGDATGAQTRRLEAIRFLRARLPADDPNLAKVLANLAGALRENGKTNEANALLEAQPARTAEEKHEPP